jgi:hypothetical protein
MDKGSTSLPPTRGEGEGRAVVPREPTRKMIASAHFMCRDDLQPTDDELRDFYQAMVAAAPDGWSIQDWAKLALDLNTYAVHDGECLVNYSPMKPCDCGLSAISRRALDWAEAVATAEGPALPAEPASAAATKNPSKEKR